MIGNYEHDAGGVATARKLAESSKNQRVNGARIEEQKAAARREEIAREKQKMREFLQRRWRQEHQENDDANQ